MSMVFGLGMRLRVRMRTKLENGVLHNGQQPQCCEWLLLTRVNLKLFKSLSGWEAACSDEHQFRAIIKASTLAVFELSLGLNKERRKERKKEKNGTFATAHFCV